ncbi:MAG TPA: hypothetical protein VFO16_02180 [Pseudonocardiaceae bacterium]|nr:hypothetical protein [Pseudonocardiaceae bacterium]
MSTQQAPSISVVQATKILDQTIAQAYEAERRDLIQRLSDARRLLVDSPVTADAERATLRVVANDVLFALNELSEMLHFRRSRLAQPGRSALARSAARAAEQRLDEVRGNSARWQKLLRDSFATITSDIDFDLRQRMQAVLAEAERTVERGNPAKDWDEFADWLRDRLSAEAMANHDLAVSSCRNVSVRVAQHVAVSEMHIVDPPPLTITTDMPTALTADQALGSGKIGLSAVVNINLRAYMGFVMFYLLTRLSGLDHLPLYLAVLPTALLGGLAVIEERNRRLEKRRDQVNATVRSYVTDFRMRVSKDSRDLLRQLEQDLRDAYTTRSEEMARSLNEARNNSHRRLEELERSPELIKEIDLDLALLEELRGRARAIIPAGSLATAGAR